MKKISFLIIALSVLTSCDSYAKGHSVDLTVLYVLIGFIVGGVLGYLFAKAPDFDFTEPNPGPKMLIPCILVWGVICAGLMFMFCQIYLQHLSVG